MKQLSKKKNYLESINNPIKIRQITLSDYIKNKKVRTIDLLKIDTQGYELNVLKGIKKQDLFKIKIILLEINFWDYYEKMTSFYEIEKILGKNFKFWDISFVYKNPKYLSTDYVDGDYIIIECYRKLDPSTYTDVWDDIFLKKYATQLIKQQWGANLSKFQGIQMLGGVALNGEQIYTQAQEELNKLEEQIQLAYELPPMHMIG